MNSAGLLAKARDEFGVFVGRTKVSVAGMTGRGVENQGKDVGGVNVCRSSETPVRSLDFFSPIGSMADGKPIDI